LLSLPRIALPSRSGFYLRVKENEWSIPLNEPVHTKLKTTPSVSKSKQSLKSTGEKEKEKEKKENA